VRRAATAIVVMLAWAMPAFADTLTPGDYRWLKTNLNVAADNLVIAALTDAQREKLHQMIGNRRGKSDDNRLAIGQYLAQTVSDSFAATLRQSEQ